MKQVLLLTVLPFRRGHSVPTLALRDSGVSSEATSTSSCTTMGPASTSSVTWCTVQPDVDLPAAITASCTYMAETRDRRRGRKQKKRKHFMGRLETYGQDV